MSAADRALILSLQPTPEVDLVVLFGDEAAWAGFVAGASAAFDPDFECAAIGTPQGNMEETGFDGLRSLWGEWLGPWASYRTTIDQVDEIGGRVVVAVHDRGRTTDSDTEVEIRTASVWTLRDHRVARVEFHLSRESAQAAARSSKGSATP
jgi:hypothetical protein